MEDRLLQSLNTNAIHATYVQDSIVRVFCHHCYLLFTPILMSTRTKAALGGVCCWYGDVLPCWSAAFYTLIIFLPCHFPAISGTMCRPTAFANDIFIHPSVYMY